MKNSTFLTTALLAACLVFAATGPLPAAAGERPVLGIEQKQAIKAVFQIDSGAMEKGVNKGLLKLDNLYAAYLKDGVKPGEIDLHAVFHGAASEHLLTDEAWNRLKNTTGGNPNTAIIASLAKRGVHIEFCNTRRIRNGWEMADIHPDVVLVSSAFQRLIDLQLRGYAIVRP